MQNLKRKNFLIPWGHNKVIIIKQFSAYDINDFMSENFEGSLPTIEEIEAELGELDLLGKG